MGGRDIAGKVWSMGGRDITGKVWSMGGREGDSCSGSSRMRSRTSFAAYCEAKEATTWSKWVH